MGFGGGTNNFEKLITANILYNLLLKNIAETYNCSGIQKLFVAGSIKYLSVMLTLCGPSWMRSIDSSLFLTTLYVVIFSVNETHLLTNYPKRQRSSLVIHGWYRNKGMEKTSNFIIDLLWTLQYRLNKSMSILCFFLFLVYIIRLYIINNYIYRHILSA